MSRPIVLTGATGFLGRTVVAELRSDGSSDLIALCRRPAPDLEGVRVEVGSLLDAAWLQTTIPDGAVVIHMAGKVEFGAASGQELHELHVETTRRLCQAVLARQGRLVLVSSSGTTAVCRTERELDETAPHPLDLVSKWPYYLTKTLQERLVLDLCHNRGLEAVILNPSLLLGPGDDRGGSTSVVADYLSGRIPAVPQGGISVVDVRDAARALRVALSAGRPGERYFLASHNCRFATFFALLSRIAGERPWTVPLPGKLAIASARLWHRLQPATALHPAMVEMAQYFWYANSAKAGRELGFAPRALEATLRDTIAYLRPTA